MKNEPDSEGPLFRSERIIVLIRRIDTKKPIEEEWKRMEAKCTEIVRDASAFHLAVDTRVGWLHGSNSAEKGLGDTINPTPPLWRGVASWSRVQRKAVFEDLVAL